MILSWDESGSGPAIVLLHAGIADRTMWASHMPALAAAGLRVVAPDLPGFGQSPPATDAQAPWSDVLDTMDVLRIDRAIVVGSSFGGAVALRVAAVAPDRVAALVLVSAPAPGVDPSQRLLAAWDAEESALERGDVDAAVEAVLDAWLLPGAPPAMRERVAIVQRRAFELQMAADDVPEAPDPLEDRSEALADIAAPALVLVGEHDMPDFHESAQLLGRTLPHARTETISAAGHLAPLERPETFARLLLAFVGDPHVR